MKKEVKSKKITIDTLAIMMSSSFERLEKKMDTMEGEIRGVKNQLEGTNKRIDDLAENRIKKEDHNKLKVRVDFIEKKLEINK